MKTKLGLAAVLPVAMLLLSAQTSRAGNATWNRNPGNGDWNIATNWTPATVPNGSTDTATFAFSNTPGVSLSAFTEVNGIVFNSGASAFTITASPMFMLTVSGVGITNNSGITQNFMTAVDGVGHTGAVQFTNSATTGTLATFTNNGSVSSGRNGGQTEFFNTSTAGNGTFTNNGGAVSGAFGGIVQFSNSSTAGNGTFTCNGSAVSGAFGGIVQFSNSSTAGNGTFTAIGSAVSGAFGGQTTFRDSSTAGNGTFTSTAGTVNGGGVTDFQNTSTAGNGTFTTEGAAVSRVTPGFIFFHHSSTAHHGTFTNNGSAVSGAFGGETIFYDTSSAGNGSMLIANGGAGGGGGGFILFQQDSTGGTARAEVFGNGNLDISRHNAPGVTTGSIEGSGAVFLGANNLTVGSNNLSTTFSGVIQDGGANGSFTKVGTGILTFEGGASNDHIADTVTLSIASSSRINLNFTGTPDTVRSLIVGGVAQPVGLYGGPASGAPHQLPVFTGTGQIQVIGAPPVITSPLSATATVGQLFVYQITATGTPTSYIASPLPAGLTSDSVSQHTGIFGGTPTNPSTTQIQLTASNSFGTGMKTLTLTVQPFPSSGPVIASGTSITARTGQPFSFDVFTTGGSATARLSASGLPLGLSADPVTGVISGTPTTDGSSRVTLTVRDGTITTTSTLQLTFTSDPAIPVITSPRETTLAAGQFFTYTIVAPSSDQSGTTFSLIGTLPLGLRFDAATGTISGTYNPGFQNGGALLGNVQGGAHNSSGSGTNPLAFFQQVPSTAVNVSTRLAVGTNDNVLIGGFIVTGNAPKKVLVRAIGPSLTAYGVPGALQNPTLELYDATGTHIAKNDDWHTTEVYGVITANQSAEIQASGLAPTDNRESAMIVTLAQHTGSPTSLTGHYTVHVLGKNGTTGAASVEVYDVGTASLDISSNAQLANISTRGLVQTGDNVMIGGFIVQGDMPATVIVRAIGPSLAQHGITNPLQDPTLELHDHTGALIASNDNWMEAPNRQAIINSGQAPSNNLESAILRSLSPGNYTAIVRGKNGTSGIALVEAYVLQ